MSHFPDNENLTDVVWLNTGFLGDMILTSAAIRLAQKKFPKSRHHLISTGLGCLALNSLSLDSYTIFEKSSNLKMISNISSVRSNLYNNLLSKRSAVLLQAHRSYRSGLLAMGLGLRTIAYEETDFNPLASIKVPRVAVLHESARVGMLLEPLGVGRDEILAARPWLCEGNLENDGEQEWKSEVSNFEGTLVALAPGSVWGTKRWTSEGYLAVAQKLSSIEGIGVLLLGGAEEKEDTNAIARNLGKEHVWDLAGKTTLDDLRGIYPKLSLLVANDSSAIHYASSFNIPTVSVFGATIPEMGFGPLAQKSVVLGANLECRPCSDHGPQVCPKGHFKCMRDIESSKVIQACLGVLDKN